MVSPGDDELFANKNVVISKNDSNYWLSYSVTTGDDAGCRHILIKADSTNQAERELHAALQEAEITEDCEVTDYAIKSLAKQVARQASRILLVGARPTDEVVLAHQGVLIHKVADGEYEVAFAQFNTDEHTFKVQRGTVKVAEGSSVPAAAIAWELQAVTEPFMGQEANATIMGALKNVPAYPADIGQRKPVVLQVLTTVKDTVGEKAKNVRRTAITVGNMPATQWNSMSETKKLAFSGTCRFHFLSMLYFRRLDGTPK